MSQIKRSSNANQLVKIIKLTIEEDGEIDTRDAEHILSMKNLIEITAEAPSPELAEELVGVVQALLHRTEEFQDEVYGFGSGAASWLQLSTSPRPKHGEFISDDLVAEVPESALG